MEKEVKKAFDNLSEQYDSQRRMLIPCYDDFYGTATLFAEVNMEKPRILDLGAGTGLFSAFILERYPGADITLLDVSEKMLEMARVRFAGLENVKYLIRDYAESGITGEFDLIISALSIHHLERENKVRLFKDIYNCLSPGGLFVNADQCLAEEEENIDLFDSYWFKHLKGTGLSQEEIENFRQRRKLDRDARLTDQISWLRDAGFRNVECVYKYIQFCVIMARR